MNIFSLFSHGCYEVFAVIGHKLSAIYTKKLSLDSQALFHVWTIKVRKYHIENILNVEGLESDFT